MTNAITNVTTSIKELTPVSKRSAVTLYSTELKPRQLVVAKLVLIAAALSAILLEVFTTISATVVLLGLSMISSFFIYILVSLLTRAVIAALLSFINQITGGLGVLILAVEVLLDFLLWM